jgi:hypothetical protein
MIAGWAAAGVVRSQACHLRGKRKPNITPLEPCNMPMIVFSRLGIALNRWTWDFLSFARITGIRKRRHTRSMTERGSRETGATRRMNLSVGRGSRKALRAGDVFTIRLVDGRHLFGRVIEAGIDMGRAPFPNSNLIYLYDVIADGSGVDLSVLRRDRLLVPPLFINRLPWSKGYFENIAHFDLTPDDVLPRHCFKYTPTRYYDRDGHPTTRTEPCGSWSLCGFGGVNAQVSRALGLPVYDD